MQQNLQSLSRDVAKQPLIKGSIPREAAISSNIRDHEQRKIVFAFKYYNHNQCEIHVLQKSDAKKLITEFGKVNNISVRDLQSNHSGIRCDKVSNHGHYTSLFDGLPQDVDGLFEIKYTETGRIFGYLVENIFNIISIKRKHIKTSKYT